jgi:predicted acyltransferase
MNSLFIYLFGHVGGAKLIESIFHPFTHALFGWTGEAGAATITALVVWLGLWGICYWMYRRKLFIKI